MQINTGQKFALSAEPVDAAGYDTNAIVTFSLGGATGENGDPVLTLAAYTDPDTGEISQTTMWVVSGAPGSDVVTVSVPISDQGETLSATEAVDVIPAGTETIRLTEGTPVEE